MNQYLSLGKYLFGMGDRYLNALKEHEVVITKNVAENLFERHMKSLLPGS